jgi:pimeloyl-ACP methyl ester carboxylesterase
MGRVTLTLPRLGETMEEARVTGWLVEVGATFARGDVLLEVETDKTVVEVPALADGVLLAHLVAPGEMVALDQPIAEVEAEGAAGADVAAAVAAPEPARAAPVARAVPLRPADGPGTQAGPRPAASPAARAAARAAGADLRLVQGSGRRGRITAADVAGVTVVLLHGLFDDSKGWRDLPRRLEARGLRVVALDLPGHGANDENAGSFGAAVAQMAARLPGGPLHLVGHSLGAALAAGMAAGLGARLRGLTLVAPAGLGDAINLSFIPAMLEAGTPDALAVPLALLDAGPISAIGLTQEWERLRAHHAGHAALARVASGEAGPLPDLPAALERLSCPVSVLMGVEDRIIDWRGVAQLPASVAIHLVRSAGHLPHLAEPEVFMRLVCGPAPNEARQGRAAM